MEPFPRPPLAFYRDRSFHLGMLVLVFLGLAWLASIFAAVSLFVNLPALNHTFMVGQSGGMIGLGIQNRSATVNFGCGAPVIGSMSGPVCLWRNPHGNLRFEIPPPVYWESNSHHWYVGVSHWLLYVPLWVAGRYGSRSDPGA